MMGLCRPCAALPMPVGTCCMGPAACAKPSKPIGQEACHSCAAIRQPCQAQDTAPICITAAGNRVHIATPTVDVECDRVITLQGHDRALVEGNVNVQLRVAYQPAGIVAERMMVGLRDGTYEINPGQGAEAVRVRLKPDAEAVYTGCPIMPAAEEQSAPAKPTDDGQDSDWE
jgi:hypothetical protein